MEDCKDLDILIATTTVGSAADAERLAREILARRLAACVQIDGGVRSLYRWEGQLCDEPEWRLVVKTLPAHAAALRALLAELHPYDLPQFTAWTAQASADYSAWVGAETGTPQA